MVLTLALAAGASLQFTSMALLLGLMTALYLVIGVLAAASFALFMNASAPPWAVTRFSAFMSATGACKTWTVWISGKLLVDATHALPMSLMALVSIAALSVLPRFEPAPQSKST